MGLLAAGGPAAGSGGASVRRILGIDPGLVCTGWGIVDLAGRRPLMVACGALRTDQRHDLFRRLRRLRDGLLEIIVEHRPAEMAVEEIFLHKDPRAALVLGHARGVAIMAGLEGGLEPFSYTALQVKKAVTGYGRADKLQVQEMVRVQLCLPQVPNPADAADALAVALTHCFWKRL